MQTHGLFKPAISIKEEKIPQLPFKIAYEKLFNNLRLVSNQNIRNINEWFSTHINKYKCKASVTSIDGTNKSYTFLNLPYLTYQDYGLFMLYTKLDEGAYSTVYLSQDINNGVFFAVKKEELHPDELPLLEREKTNLIYNKQLYATFQKEVSLLANEESDSTNEIKEEKKYKINAWLVMKLHNGVSLHRLIHGIEMDNHRKLRIARNIAYTFFQLHQDKKLHNDIKPANIMIHPVTDKIELVDFQSTLPVDQAHSLSLFATYAAPELAPSFKEDDVDQLIRTYTYQTEVYSLGITLGELFGVLTELKDVFDDIHFAYMEEKYGDANKDSGKFFYRAYQIKPVCPKEVDIDVYKLILNMIDKNPMNRPTVESVLDFFTDKCKPLPRKKIGILEFSQITIALPALKNENTGLLNTLLEMDEIWMTDYKRSRPNHTIHTETWYQLCELFMESNINLADKVFYHAKEMIFMKKASDILFNLMNQIPELVKKTDPFPEDFTYFSIECPTLVNEKTKVTPLATENPSCSPTL